MASTAVAKYLPESPQGQPISFDPRQCEDFCIVIRNLQECENGAVSNPTFLGTITPTWSIVGTGMSQTGSDPCIIDGNDAAPELHQEIVLENSKPYILYYSFEVSVGNWGCDLDGDAISGTTTLWAASADTVQTGYKRFTSGATASDTLELVFTLPAVSTPVTCYYAFICEDTGFIAQTDYCFQLPMYEKAQAELLNLTNEVVDFDQEFDNTTDYTATEDTSTAACGAPYTSEENVNATPPTATNAISGIGKFFWWIQPGDISIDWGINDDDDTIGEFIFDVYGQGEFPLPGNNDSIEFSENDSNTTDELFFLGDNDWDSSTDDPVELYIRAKSQCDVDTGNERVKYDVEVNNFSAYPAFFEKTATMASDTFYRLKYKLNKCSISSVKVVDSGSTTIFQASSDGVGFDMIFKTGTLPTTTVTIRFEIGDMLEFPNTDFEKSVLTEVQLWEICDWTIWMEEDDETFVAAFTETHDTTAQTVGTEYHPNIEYCFDVNSLVPGCYQVRAIDGCDVSRYWISNCFLICKNNKELTEISWTPGIVICSGSEVLDYVAYPDTQYFWIKADLQDLTIEEENAMYRRSDGYWEKPWSYQNTIEVLQVWPMPPFLRYALAVAMTGVFKINGVEYEKLNDDAYTPQFNAVYESPMRILVAKVGNHIISRQ